MTGNNVVQRWTFEVDVPLEAGSNFEAGFKALAGEHGADIVSASGRPHSKDFEGIFSVTEIKILLDAGIKTLDQLCGCTEKDLLAVEGIDFPRLRRIICKLYKAKRVLKGHTLGNMPDSIEVQTWIQRRVYEQIKEAGINFVAQIEAMEPPELVRQEWWDSLQHPFEAKKRKYQPTRLTRSLKDFGFSYPLYLVAAEITPQDLTALTKEQLTDRLRKCSGIDKAPGGAEGVAEVTAREFEFNGHSLLPSGE